MKRVGSLCLICGLLVALGGCGVREAEITLIPTLSPSQAVVTPATEPTPPTTPEPILEPTLKPPTLAEMEFSIVVGAQTLTLGEQAGAFPWGTELEADSERYWSSDGFPSFELTCGEGLLLGGFRPEKSIETTENAILRTIENRSPNYKTYRGAYVGMSMEDFQALYPDAEEISSGHRYDYTDPPNCFLKQIVFYFEENQLVEFRIVIGVDDWAY